MQSDVASSSNAFRYWAFISYSRHDARIAKQLVEQLGRMQVPAELRCHVLGAPPTFAPIFLDTHDASAAPALNTELQRALSEAARLIVVCSPFAVQSAYVAEEIRHFQQLGRDSDILCVIASGEPDATARGQPALECFPAPLRIVAPDDGRPPPRPLAAHLGQETPANWQMVREQLAAGLVGLPLPAWREAVSKRRVKRLAWLGAGIVATFLATWALAWAMWLPQTVHAKHAVRRWGALQPVDEIPSAMAAKRPSTYRFERRGAWGPWTLVRAVDGDGQCTQDQGAIQSIVGEPFTLTCTRSRACAVSMAFEGGQLISEKVLDQNGQVLETVNHDRLFGAVLHEASIGCSRREGNIEFLRIERHTSGPMAGLDRELRFGGGEDKSPRPNAAYVFGWRFVYDESGRITERTALGPNGQPRPDKAGQVTLRTRYNDVGDIVEEDTLGLDGQPFDNASGYAIKRMTFDHVGRETSRRFFDAHEQATRDEHGLHGKVYQYDERGRLTGYTHLGLDNKQAPDEHGVAQVRIDHPGETGRRIERYMDGQGRPVPDGKESCEVIDTLAPPKEPWKTERCFLGNGTASYAKAGWHLHRSVFDEHDNQVADAYFDDKDRPTLCTDPDMFCPHHRSESQFDNRGNVVSTRFFGKDGKLAYSQSGVSQIDFDHDPRNRTRQTISRGPDGRPAPLNGKHVGLAFTYDNFGRIVERRRVDAEGKPLLLGRQPYATRTTYDDHGHETQVEALDTQGRRVFDALNELPAIVRGEHDARGRLIQQRFFDERDLPTTDQSGFFGVRLSHDAWGRVISGVRLGPDGQPQATAEGDFEWRTTYNPQGFMLHYSLHGADGRLRANTDGVAQWSYTVDSQGHTTSMRLLDILGQLVADKEGFAGYDKRFNERGQLIQHTYIGRDNRPIGDKTAGVAIVRYEVDEMGRNLKVQYFDAQDHPKANADGLFAAAYRYNARGQVMEVRNLAANGELALNKAGVARQELDHDAVGGLTEQRFFDASGRPTLTAQAAIVRHRNDASGREIERTFFDQQDHPIPSPSSGRARVIFTRDIWGRLLEEKSLDLQGHLVNRKDEGWARRTYHRDSIGTLIESRCFDAAGHILKTCPRGE